MAQDLRARLRLLAAYGAAALGACGNGADAAPAAPAPLPQPTAVDSTRIAEDALVAAVLDECHRPLRGRLQRLVALVTLPDDTEVELFAELPDRLHAQSPAGRFLLRGDAVVRIDGDLPATAAEQQRVRALRALLDAAAFGPLHRATGCRRRDDGTFEILGSGTPVILALRAGTLLPASLRLGDDTIAVVDYLRTPTSWVARELEHPQLGRCRVRLEQAQIEWSAGFFDPPAAATPAPPPTTSVRLPSPGSRGEPRLPTPQLRSVEPWRWLVVRDPGDWAARAAAYEPLHAELARQEQQIAGFPALWRDDGGCWLAAPFRRRPGGREFAPPAGWVVRDAPHRQQLVVYPDTGAVEERIAAGERLLQAAVAAQGLRAVGPITAQPFFHLHEGAPTAAKLAAPVVRVAVAVD